MCPKCAHYGTFFSMPQAAQCVPSQWCTRSTKMLQESSTFYIKSARTREFWKSVLPHHSKCSDQPTWPALIFCRSL